MANESHCAADIRYDLRNEVLWAAAVPHWNKGEAFLQKSPETHRRLLRRVVGRDPSSADHEDNSGSVRFRLRLHDVEGQCETVFVTIDHVWNDIHFGCW